MDLGRLKLAILSHRDQHSLQNTIRTNAVTGQAGGGCFSLGLRSGQKTDMKAQAHSYIPHTAFDSLCFAQEVYLLHWHDFADWTLLFFVFSSTLH
jgi:hypothetical protein